MNIKYIYLVNINDKNNNAFVSHSFFQIKLDQFIIKIN